MTQGIWHHCVSDTHSTAEMLRPDASAHGSLLNRVPYQSQRPSAHHRCVSLHAITLFNFSASDEGIPLYRVCPLIPDDDNAVLASTDELPALWIICQRRYGLIMHLLAAGQHSEAGILHPDVDNLPKSLKGVTHVSCLPRSMGRYSTRFAHVGHVGAAPVDTLPKLLWLLADMVVPAWGKDV